MELWKVNHSYINPNSGNREYIFEIVEAKNAQEALDKYNNLAEKRKNYPYFWDKQNDIKNVRTLKNDIIR